MRVRLLKILDATAGYLLCLLGGRVLLWKRGNEGARPAAVAPGKILVIRPGGMGDMILLLPMLRSLRQHYPEARIDVVCEKRNREILVLAGDPAITLLYDAAPLSTLYRLLRGGYDLAIDTEQFHHFSAVIAWLSGAPLRIGFKINPVRNSLYTHLVTYDLEGYEADEFRRLLAPLGIHEAAVVEGCLGGPTSAAPEAGSLNHSPAIVLHIGASTRYKRWDTEKYAELVRRLGQDPGCQGGDGMICLVGGAPDKSMAEEIARRSSLGARVRCAAGAGGLAETASFIRGARLFIGGDSGLMHMAVAMGIPVVALFGPSDPLKWVPRGGRVAVVRKNLACSPCFIFGYHKLCRSIACMAGVTVEDVMAAVTTARVSAGPRSTPCPS